MKSISHQGNRQKFLLGWAGLMGTALGCSPALDADLAADNGGSEVRIASETHDNDFGQMEVFQRDPKKSDFGSGNINRNNAFFKSLGTNGRSCHSCHRMDGAMGISLESIQDIFDSSDGKDPLFRVNDGSNAPTGPFADVSTKAKRQASFSMLLTYGVIRVGIPMPATADFTLDSVKDPYNFASAAELSLFRRPMPTANVAFNTLTMWDGRESEGRPDNRDALLNQANDATTGHAQATTPLTAAQRAEIVDFELNLFAAQNESKLVGDLDKAACRTNKDGEPCEEARGGAKNLISVLLTNPGGVGGAKFFPGINDPFKPGFDHISMKVFEAWESDDIPPSDKSTLTKNRTDIGDGEDIFYTKPIKITDVPGLNDAMGKPVIDGFCTTCHNTPDVGNHSSARFMNTGTAYVDKNPLFTKDFPVYVFKPTDGGDSVTVMDPGVGLRTGKFADIGKFKVPQLRGLGARAPYFHNGGAKTLTDVVNFYNQRFSIGLTADEIRKVVLFLQQT